MKMSKTKSENSEENFLLIELLNRELKQDLELALKLISIKKQSFTNLDKYEVEKNLIFLIETQQNNIDKECVVIMLFK